MIAESATPARLGRAFGLHRSLDTFGAALGPLAAFALLAAFPDDFRRVFLLSALPGVLAVIVLPIFVRAKGRATRREGEPGPRRGQVRAMKRLLLVTALFGLGNISLTFLLLRARELGFQTAHVPLVYLGYNLVYALLSWPMGKLSARIGRRPLILMAYMLHATVYAVLAWRAGPITMAAALATLGLQSAMLETSQRALIAGLVPVERRATAFGAYYTVAGLALLTANALAGWLWDGFGPRAVFMLGASLTALAALAFAVAFPPRREEEVVGHAGDS